MPLFKKKLPLLLKGNTIGNQTGVVQQGSPKAVYNGSMHRNSVAPEDHFQSFQPNINPLSAAEECYEPKKLMRTKSRLWKTLQEFLDDHSSLAYFIQFMESEGVKHLVKFWLEVQSFRSAVLMRAVKTDNVKIEVPNTRTRTRTKSGKSVSFQIDEENEKLNNNKLEDNTSAETDVIKKPIVACATSSYVESVSNNDDEKEKQLEKVQCATTKENELDQQPVPKNCKTKLRTSSEEDAWHIYQKYLAKDAPCSVGVLDSIREEILEIISLRDTLLEPECFDSAQAFVQKRMETSYFASFLRSSFHCKHQVDMLTSGQVFLADILYNDSTLFYFMEFMEQEGVRHLVDFLLMADNFRNHLLDQRENGYDSEQAQSDAMVIYDKYFSLQATSPLGLSDHLRFELEQNICHESGLQPDCFLKPVMILLQHIEKTYLPQFLSSELYFKYLSECILTIQTSGLVQGHRKRSGSDSSSSDISSLSQQTQNTLLAMDSKQAVGSTARRQIKNIAEQDMRIDTGLFEPDTLWRRNMSGKLQMAHVDQYGKLISEFEPEPEKKTGSKLTKAVRKLVNWEDDKTEETMAWQVAEMIVKDVCNITLGQDDKTNEKINL